MNEVYYLIYTTTEYDDSKSPVYLLLVNGGRMIQGNLYDASKFVSKERAEKELKEVSEFYKDREFDIIPVDKRIFGRNPRWIEE